MKLLLKCPKCGNNQLYESKTALLNNKTKKCVYCGRCFQAKEHIVRAG